MVLTKYNLEKAEKIMKMRSLPFIQTTNETKKEEREGEDWPIHINLL